LQKEYYIIITIFFKAIVCLFFYFFPFKKLKLVDFKVGFNIFKENR